MLDAEDSERFQADVNLSTVPANAHKQPQPNNLVLLCLIAWLIPGAGHLWLGRRAKGLVLLVALPLMFAIGLAVEGRVASLDFSEPLVGLACLANAAIGLPYFVANVIGAGAGDITASTYEYGNTFLIVAGLLNVLVVMDAYDIAVGRK
jgi:hypothetical protein